MSVAAASGVWADLVGQEKAVGVLRAAVIGGRHAMTLSLIHI